MTDLARWLPFSDKEIFLIENALATVYSDKMHAHGMMAEICVEQDRRRRADESGIPRAEFER